MNWPSESKAARLYRLTRWHTWFAWRPVRIGERKHWLETVERVLHERTYRYEDGYHCTYYRPEYRVKNHNLKKYAN